MAINICSRSGQTHMGVFHFVNVSATVYLQETDVNSGKFQCLVHYKYSGVAKGSGMQTLPISGNTKQQKQLPHGITLDVDVSNWALTSAHISFLLTASISGHGMGPDYLFQNTAFGGQLPSITMEQVDAKIAASLAAHSAY